MRIGILGVNFGWGPHAALETILSEIRRTEPHCWIVGFGSEYGRTLLDDVVDEWCDFNGTDYGKLEQSAVEQDLDVALVTLEGFAARAFEAADVPTVFVDLMPFLWHGTDLAVPPLTVSKYLALSLPGLSEETLSWMKTIKNLRWIGAVVPWEADSSRVARCGYEEGNRQAIITLGGMLGLTMHDTTSYPALVLPGVVDALVDFGFEKILIAGNVPHSTLDSIVLPYRDQADFRLGPIARSEYRSRIGESALCLTQPGLMSLLEASSCGTPLIRLPPQNVSGFHQSEIHRLATGADTAVMWPTAVVDESVALRKAKESEAVGNDYVYSAIIDGLLKQSELTHSFVKSQLSEIIPSCIALPRNTWVGLMEKLGADGAQECAETVLAMAGVQRLKIGEGPDDKDGDCIR